MVDSNAKGMRGELQARDAIREWWRVLEPGTDFTRTPKSGGWHAAGEYDMAGDLMTTARLFPFCVEVKWRENWVLDRVIVGQASPVWKWWMQACRDAAKTEPHRVPMLWFRKRSTQWFVMVPRPYIQSLGSAVLEPTYDAFPDIVWRHLPLRPVIYEAARFLLHDPSVFARRAA